MEKTTTPDEYITKHPEWTKELELLRVIVTSCEVEETVKWGMPTYTVAGKNVAGIGAFKGYVGIWFFQGGLLADQQNKLINAQEGKTQAMRQWRFSSVEEIEQDRTTLISYIDEAIKNQKDGKEIKPQKKPLIVPHELQSELDNNKHLWKAFDELTLGKKRDYAEYISTAKREETRKKRIEKILPMIEAGIGLNDKYK